MEMKTFGERMKHFRENHLKMGLREMGREAGLSGANIHSWEHGGSMPTLPKLKKIYKAFPTLSPMWLEDGNGDMLLPEVTISFYSDKAAKGEIIEELKASYEKMIAFKDGVIEELKADKRFLQNQCEQLSKPSAA